MFDATRLTRPVATAVGAAFSIIRTSSGAAHPIAKQHVHRTPGKIAGAEHVSRE